MWKSNGAWLLNVPHFVPGTEEKWAALEPEHPQGWNPQSRAAADEYWFVEEFVRALDQGRDHVCSGEKALHVLEIMMGVFESAAYGRAVELPQRCREHPLLRWRREKGLGELEQMPRPYAEWLAEEERHMAESAGKVG